MDRNAEHLTESDLESLLDGISGAEIRKISISTETYDKILILISRARRRQNRRERMKRRRAIGRGRW
jgi:hypothetical protein